jgi:hypothetical protein
MDCGEHLPTGLTQGGNESGWGLMYIYRRGPLQLGFCRSKSVLEMRHFIRQTLLCMYVHTNAHIVKP